MIKGYKNANVHEILDDTVEFGAFVTIAELFASLVLAGSKGAEVLHSFGDSLKQDLEEWTQRPVVVLAYATVEAHGDCIRIS